ncbi:hypothetical protein RB601_000976 [Gaeumannomyces tritici]
MAAARSLIVVSSPAAGPATSTSSPVQDEHPSPAAESPELSAADSADSPGSSRSSSPMFVESTAGGDEEDSEGDEDEYENEEDEEDEEDDEDEDADADADADDEGDADDNGAAAEQQREQLERELHCAYVEISKLQHLTVDGLADLLRGLKINDDREDRTRDKKEAQDLRAALRDRDGRVERLRKTATAERRARQRAAKEAQDLRGALRDKDARIHQLRRSVTAERRMRRRVAKASPEPQQQRRRRQQEAHELLDCGFWENQYQYDVQHTTVRLRAEAEETRRRLEAEYQSAARFYKQQLENQFQLLISDYEGQVKAGLQQLLQQQQQTLFQQQQQQQHQQHKWY